MVLPLKMLIMVGQVRYKGSMTIPTHPKEVGLLTRHTWRKSRGTLPDQRSAIETLAPKMDPRREHSKLGCCSKGESLFVWSLFACVLVCLCALLAC